MTEEDQRQIRSIVREEITAHLAPAVAELKANQDRAVEAIAGEMSTLRTELNQRIDGLSGRLDNLAPVVISADARMATFTRSVDRLISAHNDTAGTQAATQRAFDQLAARVATLEKAIQEIRPNPPQQ